MSQVVRVFVNASAPPSVAGWFDNMMAPVIEACRFKNEPPAVELRSQMQSAGQTRRADGGQRVLLAGRATFWGRFALASTYLHEVAHVLCDRLPGRAGEAHGPVFCLTLSCLYERAAAVSHLAGLPCSISFYDFADKPDELSDDNEWQAEVVRFLMTETRKLAHSLCSAEALASGANEAWGSFISNKVAAAQASKANDVRQNQLHQRLKKMRARLRTAYNWNFSWVACAVVGWFFALVNGAACQLK